ncbi:MAG: hypothetical protein LIO43_04700, partial [Clostridiales bacterium]|nr:hypothetical protein [Clostridiales bacterium]
MINGDYMFYQFSDDVITVDVNDLDSHYITAGYVKLSEFKKIYEKLGFSRSTVDVLENDDFHSRFGVEVYDDYCFTKLSVINTDGLEGDRDCIAIYLKNNLFIVVDIKDNDCSTMDKFLSSLNKYSSINITLEKLIFSFFDSLTNSDYKFIEDKGFEITKLEEIVLKDKAGSNFNLRLLQMKKELLILRNYYEQLIDIGGEVNQKCPAHEKDCVTKGGRRYI